MARLARLNGQRIGQDRHVDPERVRDVADVGVVDADDRQRVRLYFSAPPEAPTTRGFASILATGLDGQSADAILAVPDDFYSALGLVIESALGGLFTKQ